MATLSLKIDYSQSQLCKNMENFSLKIGAAALMLMNTEAVRIESVMKRNRPWTDRTGAAKAMLRTVVTQPSETMIRMTLAHGVDYGMWLELAHEKKWAIIAPTLESEGPAVIGKLSSLMDKIKF